MMEEEIVGKEKITLGSYRIVEMESGDYVVQKYYYYRYGTPNWLAWGNVSDLLPTKDEACEWLEELLRQRRLDQLANEERERQRTVKRVIEIEDCLLNGED